MATNATPAEIFLGLGGKVLTLVGLGFVSVGGLYGVNKISTSAIRIIESLPFWLSMKENKEEEANKAIITRQDVKKGISSYTSIIGVIIAGGVLGYFGRYVSSEATIAAANGLIYKV